MNSHSSENELLKEVDRYCQKRFTKSFFNDLKILTQPPLLLGSTRYILTMPNNEI